MILDRTKNTVRGISTGIVNKATTLFLPFVVRTVLIQKVGIEYAGLSGLFASILQVLNLAELGFSDAVVHSMYQPVAEDDEEMLCALLGFYRRIYFVIGLIIFTVGLLLIPFLTRLIHGSYPADVNLYVLYLIYLLNTSISYLFFGYKNSILNAFQRRDKINNISTVTNVFLNVMQLILLITTKNYYLYVIVLPLSTLLNNLLISYEVKRSFPQYVGRGIVPEKIKQDMKKKVSGLLIQKLCATTRNTFDSIFISAFLGLTISAIYSNYYEIMHALNSFMTIITTSMLGGVGNSVQTESKEVNYANMRRFNFMYMWISGWFTAALVCLYQPFMELWMGRAYMFDFKAVLLLCLYFYVQKTGDIRSVYYEAAGLWWEGRGRAMLETALNIVLNALLLQKMGIYGIILATLISMFAINFLYGSQFVFRYYFGMEKLKEYYVLHGIYFAGTAVCAAVTYYSCWVCAEVLPIKSAFLLFLLKTMICILIPNLILLILYAGTGRFQETLQWIKRRIKI